MTILDETVKLWRSTSFVWGQQDCLLSVGDYIMKHGGNDISSRFRGSYSDESGAMEIVERNGGFDKLIDMTGATPIEPSETTRGDVVLMDLRTHGDSQIAGINLGDVVIARTKRGALEIPVRFLNITHAWNVKCQTL